MKNSLKGSVVGAAMAMIAGSGTGADLPDTKAPPPPPPPVFSWQGGYVGLYAGAILSEGAFTFINQTPLRGPAFIGGGALGYNWQWTDKIVLAAEADFGYRGVIQAERVGNSYPNSTDSGVLGTVRGRAGYAFAPRWLAYATAGLAFGTNFVSNSFSSIFPPTYGQLNSGPTLRPGWVAGAGFEYAWSDNISVKGEYLYAWLADSGVAYNTNRGVFNANVSSAGHVVRGGLNYHFSTAAISAPPVLTK